MDPVCANHNVGVGGRAVVELHFDAVSALGQSDAPMVKMKHAARHCCGKNVEQFGAMEVIVRGTEVTLAGVGQGLPSDHAPVVPAANDGRARPHSEEAQRFLKSEPMENSRRIGTYLDAGANLAQFRGLFEHLNLEARAPKSPRPLGRRPGSNQNNSHVHDHSPFAFVGQPALWPCRPPAIGEDTDQILRAEAIPPPRRIELEMDSTEAPVYAQQEQSVFRADAAFAKPELR